MEPDGGLVLQLVLLAVHLSALELQRSRLHRAAPHVQQSAQELFLLLGSLGVVKHRQPWILIIVLELFDNLVDLRQLGREILFSLLGPPIVRRLGQLFDSALQDHGRLADAERKVTLVGSLLGSERMSTVFHFLF